eukprot:CAMPEP_0177604524 /NCGR_PEP_ID=MMETSP0419_2-20121207/16169_1 /TAXON_ID=582737 /ORGANISM="Tetraselmis sp., Strain GSL018" /LENGTH=385 /DNA_ID=CAMNT_0019098523 /DNA_START=365 /DNA_END=1518 /DNA_ORIENTATION=+
MNYKLKIQQGKDVFALNVDEDSKLLELQQTVEAATGVFVRQQKLIFRGKILEGPSETIKQLSIRDGSKIMLVSSASGRPTAGQDAARAQAALKAQEAKARIAQGLPSRSAPGGAAAAAPPGAPSWAERAAGWAKTGVVALRGEALAEVPAEVCSVGGRASTLDLRDNALASLGGCLGHLPNLSQLWLSGNRLGVDPGACAAVWEGAARLPALRALSLDRNSIAALPPCVGTCKALRSLRLAGNRLRSLPEEVGELRELRELDVSGNELGALPAALGDLAALEALRAGSNQLSELPPELSRLQRLALLSVPGNRLRGVPPAVLRGCARLRSIDLHGNPVTVQQLRETDGWELFDARRRAACDKGIESGVMPGTGAFDEGADELEWR